MKSKKFKKNTKEKIIAGSGSLSGILSFLGSYQVCHNLCTSIIAILAGIGITLKGMPLLFLQKVSVPFWISAVTLLLFLTILKIKNKTCVSNKTLLLNSGLIIAGIPFRQFESFAQIFWVVGAAIVLWVIFMYIKNKIYSKTLIFRHINVFGIYK